MTERYKKYLVDMINAIELVEQFVIDTPNFPQYQNDAKTKSAVERQLIILGEAVNKFNKEATDLHLSNLSQIVSFWNRLAHEYDKIDDSIVWAIVKNHLPILKEEAKKYLETT